MLSLIRKKLNFLAQFYNSWYGPFTPDEKMLALLGIRWGVFMRSRHCTKNVRTCILLFRGWILGRDWDKSLKSLKSFPPCYSQSSLLTDFTPPPPPPPPQQRWKSGLKLVCIVNLKPVFLELSRLCPETERQMVRSWIRLQDRWNPERMDSGRR
jgi:hypothetical protein